MFSLCVIWPIGSYFVSNLTVYFFSVNHPYKKNQTTSTFSLKPLVGATLALKALLNCRSSLPFASDDVIT